MAENNYDEIEDRADWSLIPEPMHHAVHAWVELGRRPGHFLTAVLENNLAQAVSHADEQNQAAIVGWVRFVYNYLPSGCWGSPAIMDQWAEGANEHFEELQREYAETKRS